MIVKETNSQIIIELVRVRRSLSAACTSRNLAYAIEFVSSEVVEG